MSTTGEPVASLRHILRASSPGADEHWRQWGRALMQPVALTPSLLGAFWREVCDFDPVLDRHVARPLPVPDRTVIVAGSGKETVKTFNVSTAASILATAAGARVVKGVSSSVSAVSGAADVLDALDIPAVTEPERVGDLVAEQGIAFVSYGTFCPTYAGRYDGVFHRLSPFSFFMPVAVLALRASAFVYGVAHPDVELAGRAIGQARPDLPTGVVVSTTLGPGEVMDERAPFGLTATAEVRAKQVRCHEDAVGWPPASWRRAVAHRDSHSANAAAVADSLALGGCADCGALVELNAAVIVQAGQPDATATEALAAVRTARSNGAAGLLLACLQRSSNRVGG